jgi:murein DD-endopeptidase MepM/ murein hydrolase activator NlpD
MRVRSLLSAVLVVLASTGLASAAETIPFSAFSVQPQVLVNGSVCLLSVRVAGNPHTVSAKWMNRELTFSPGPRGTWYALVGVAYEAKPGTYDLALQATLADGRTVGLTRSVVVHAGKYKTSRLSVPQKYVTPDPETLKRIEAEKGVKKAAFAHEVPLPEWSGDFVAPVQSAVSENYGTSRTFNGKLASVHRGTDFRAPSGTPVHASNAGEVVLARELYYEGNCVVIDHGLGFMTLYMHLSKFEVKEGDKVQKGQVIALSGGTGRVTGPHLHLSVRWNGEYLDPLKLLALELPEHP